MESVNPATGEVLAKYVQDSSDVVNRKIKQTHEAHLEWRRKDFSERAQVIRQMAAVLREQKILLARLMANEMGKPVTEGSKEVEKCASVCDFYAENSAQFLSDQAVETEAFKSYVHAQPMGVILGVMPWNFPFWQVYRFAVPALMAGNGVLLKHASNVMGCATEIEKLFLMTDGPAGLFSNLKVASDKVDEIIENPLVQGVSLTGSTPAGRAVASTAGRCLKKLVLELGGSDPYVVLEDADIQLAAESCAQSRLINNGQSCIAAKRFIVVGSAHDEFLDRLSAELQKYSFGNPLDEKTMLGPMARKDLQESLHGQVCRSVEKGAKKHFGGELPEGKGAFYPVTLLSGVTPGMPAFDEELFGPVAVMIKAKDEARAIALANQTEFGLGAAVFTRDLVKGERLVREQLQAGACFLNTFVRSDPRLPFGGIKDSGFGRELGNLGIQEFVNHKTIYLEK